MSKKRRITPAMIRSATGRIAHTNLQMDVYAKTVSGRFSAKVENTANTGRSDSANTDYSVIEQRVIAMGPVFAAPYGKNRGADILDSAEQFFIDVFSGRKAPAAKGRFREAGGQMQNIPRSREDKDNADE